MQGSCSNARCHSKKKKCSNARFISSICLIISSLYLCVWKEKDLFFVNNSNNLDI